MGKLQQLEGRVFGELQVIERGGTSNGRASWLVECPHGERFPVRSDKLLQGLKTTCGHKNPKLCSIEGCGKPHEARGYCNKHYSRWYQHGDPHTVLKRGRPKKETFACSVPGDDSPAYALGLCALHYNRQRTTGSVELQPREPRFCDVEDCDEKHRSLGYCEKHYWRVRTYGSPEAPPSTQPKFCSVEDCDSPHNALGFCNLHYTRYRKWGDPHFVPEHPGWLGDDINYEGIHARVVRAFGKAAEHECPCGKTASHWSYSNECRKEKTGPEGHGRVVAWCPHVDCYEALCVSCHKIKDLQKAEVAA